MALSSLSPPPPYLPTHSASASLPKLLHSNFSFPPTSYPNNVSTTTSTNFRPDYGKWRAHVSFFPAFFNNKTKNAESIKLELLEEIAPLDRGAEASPEDQERVDQIARKLEAVNPTKEPLKSSFLNGKWELIYTTSQSILQTQVTADLTPLNARKVAVKFDYFKIGGLIPVKAPDRARGELEISYLDVELRVSRGDKGNLFILKMVDPLYEIPS
ncbi:Hypothetical predicted protein [Olea europaea subsp. europaea]|uniref:Plastid lipid-associated protein/fibrillin conserved domain-containing protein n=1 Tax=Olea europaea subsp. europaea TaxID=158383 RepID=A0A8S0P9S0_OLEEU|nr:Hypothetical predicted protein [Olea europaea subsp. europaea]